MKLARLLHKDWHRPDGPDRYQQEGLNIMSRFNFDAVRSFAIAGVASLYASMMLIAAVSTNGAEIGRLVI